MTKSPCLGLILIDSGYPSSTFFEYPKVIFLNFSSDFFPNSLMYD